MIRASNRSCLMLISANLLGSRARFPYTSIARSYEEQAQGRRDRPQSFEEEERGSDKVSICVS